jgi:hypothetical protein
MLRVTLLNIKQRCYAVGRVNGGFETYRSIRMSPQGCCTLSEGQVVSTPTSIIIIIGCCARSPAPLHAHTSVDELDLLVAEDASCSQTRLLRCSCRLIAIWLQTRQYHQEIACSRC